MLFLFPWPPRELWGPRAPGGPRGSQGVMPFRLSAQRWAPPVAERGGAGLGEQGSPVRGPGQGLVPREKLNPGPDTRPRLGLPPGQLTIYCGTARRAVPFAAAALRVLCLHSAPRVCPVAMAGLVVSGTQVSSPGTNPALAWGNGFGEGMLGHGAIRG